MQDGNHRKAEGSMSEQKIYLVEDDENIRELVRCTLESFAYEVSAFETAEEMLSQVEKSLPDLILLDIMLPGMEGIEALRILKSNARSEPVPVIMLTAKNSEIDKVRGLDLGADDYIGKPFGILELTARVRTALRRKEKMAAALPSMIYVKDLCIDDQKHQVTQNGIPVELTLKEYQLLKLLAENKERVIPREELLNVIWGIDFAGETRTLDMHIKSLRAKLSDNPGAPRYIKTVRGVGYLFLA